MVVGDIDFMRKPVAIDKNGSPDTAFEEILGAHFPSAAYDVVDVHVVKDKDITSNKFVLVAIGRRTT